MIEHQLAVKVYPATQTEAETKKMRKLTWKRLVPPSRGWSPSRCSAVFGAGLRFHKEVSGGSGGNSANHRQNSITQQPSPQGAHGVSGSMSGISPECLRPRLRVLGLGFGAIKSVRREAPLLIASCSWGAEDHDPESGHLVHALKDDAFFVLTEP